MENIKENLGEEYKGDSCFVAECRKLQSIYRAEIGEEIRPYKDRNGHEHHYCNYISNGEVAKEGCWKNFLTEYAFKYAQRRVVNRQKRETIEADRLFNNLLSSQPMAFNLFCPLMQMREEFPETATKAIKAAFPWCPIREVTDIDLEFIPENYKDLTGDKSAMDAIIRFVDTDSKRGFIAIETKYSENLGTNVASRNEKAIETIKQLECFVPDIEERIKAGKPKLTQIYRNFLLSEAYGAHEGLESYSVILAPKKHPTTKNELASLMNELREEYRYRICSITLEEFVAAIAAHSPQEYRTIFERFHDRYLNFEKLAKYE